LCKELGFKIVEKYFTPEEIKGADSAFFTGTAAEVAGIKSIDNIPFKLNWEDSLGYILQAKYNRRVAFNEYGNFSLV
jgi:branched-chain amino acid aminotransferase